MTADLQDLFDQAGRNAPTRALDADAVLRRARARRTRNRRITSAVAATVAVTVVLGVGLASQHVLSAAPVPAAPLPTASSPTAPTLGSLGRLAYASNGDIYLADADGSNRVRIADGVGDCPGYWVEGTIWSPDGRYVAYRGDPDGDIRPTGCFSDRTVNISTADGHRVASIPGDGWAIAWSPDSTRVAAWIDYYPGTMIGIYGIDGVRQAVLTVPRGLMAAGDFDPVWSPDGASLLLPFGVEIPVDGTAPRQLPAGDPRSQWKFTPSPDGGDVAYITQDGLAVAAADGSHVRVLIPTGVEGSEEGPAALAWSPTGDRIAFVMAMGQLGVVNVASGTVVSLAGVSEVHSSGPLRFTPEGDQILFARSDAETEDGASLWSVHADGSGLHRLVAGAVWGDWQTLTPTR